MSETLDVQHTQEIGYRAETVDGTPDLTDVDLTTYAFGIFVGSWGRYPQYRYEVMTPYRGASMDPYEIRLSKAIVDGGLSINPSNAQMIYHAVANSSSISETIATGGNTITFADAGPDTITRASGDWTSTFSIRKKILINGSTSNDGLYTIAFISALVITLKSTDELSAEAMSSGNLVVLNSGVAVTGDHGDGNFTYAFMPVQNVKPQPYTIRANTSNDIAATHQNDVVGARTSQLSFQYDFGAQDTALASNLGYMGTNMQPSSDVSSGNYETPVYADGNSLEAQEYYDFDDNMEVRWDIDGDNVDLIPYLLDFNMIINIANRFRFVQGQLYPKWVGVANRTLAVTFRLTRADETSVFDDFLAQAPGNDFKAMRFKIFKNATDYLEFTMHTTALIDCQMNNTHDGEKQEPFYDVKAVVTSVTFKSRESTPNALYGL